MPTSCPPADAKRCAPVPEPPAPPVLQADGKPLPAPVFCLMHDQAMRDEVVTALSRNGIGAFAVRGMVGVGDGPQTERSIATMIRRLANVARLAPEAWLMADCDLYPSEAWMLAHPHDGFLTADNQILVLGKDGESDRRAYVTVPGPTPADVPGGRLNDEPVQVPYGRRRVSPFSRRFARQAVRTFRRIETEAERAGFSHRLWGYFLGCYICGEWNLHMTAPDHGQTAVRAFRRYLRDTYGNTPALQAAWHDPCATLAGARPPREHAPAQLPGLPTATPRQVDYRRAEARALADQFLTLAQGVKRLNPNRAVGGFFPGANAPQSDWLRLAKAPCVDFLATPLAYENRGPGHGVNSQSPFCDGFAALGKVWFDELDTRTRFAGGRDVRYGRAKTLSQSVELLWRDAGQMLIRGHHGWWLDFGNHGAPPHSWHLHPEILAFHRQFAALWQRLDRFDRRPRGDIKVFIPADAALHYPILGLTDIQRHTEWTLLGAPVECDVLENLLEGRSTPAKLTLIHAAVSLSADTLARLHECLRHSGSVVVWMGGAGLCAAGQLPDPERLETLLPIRQRISLGADPYIPVGRPTPEAVARLGLSPTLRLGQHERRFSSGFAFMSKRLNVPMPRIPVAWQQTIADPDAVPLARRDTDRAVVAALKTDAHGTTHVLYTLPVLNTGLLRALASMAGCHLFTPHDDVVFASRGLLLLHAAFTGDHPLHVPPGTDVEDLRRGGSVTLRSNRLTLELQKGETRLFRLSDAMHGHRGLVPPHPCDRKESP